MGIQFFSFSSMMAKSRVMNGFKIKDPLIPLEEIFSRGPPRDGIPSIDDPRFVAAEKADFLLPQHQVLGLELDGEKRAYPILILNWHEIVNDVVGGVPVTVRSLEETLSEPLVSSRGQ